MLLKTFILIIGLSGLFNCRSRPSFDSWEMAWMSVYNEGDTLIFKSANQDIDTIFIVQKDQFYQEKDGDLKLYGAVWYRNTSLKYHPNGARLITLIKSQSGETSFNINLFYSSYLVADFNEKSMMKLKQESNVYSFKTQRENGRAELPKLLSWHSTKGLIEYVTHDDVVWTLAN